LELRRVTATNFDDDLTGEVVEDFGDGIISRREPLW
jgi:hypothetical protein